MNQNTNANRDTRTEPRRWRRAAPWRIAGGVLVIVLTMWSHWRWWHQDSPGLHAVPALCLGALLFLLLDGGVAFVVGTSRRPREAFRWLASGSTWRGGLWRVAFAVTVIALFYNIEFWRGRRAWAAVGREASAMGETLTSPEPASAEIPEDRNLAAAPLLAPLRAEFAKQTDFIEDGGGTPNLGALDRIRDWNPALQLARGPGRRSPLAPWIRAASTDLAAVLRTWPRRTGAGTNLTSAADGGDGAATEVLRRLTEFEADLGQLREYATRPYCRFALDYPRQMWRPNHAHAVMVGYTRIVRIRALALLAAGRDDEAFEDVQLMLRLLDLGRQQPWAMLAGPRSWLVVDAMQPVWEGLRRRRWSPAKVASLQRQLARLDVLSDYPANARNQARAMADMLESFVPAAPGPKRVPTVLRRDERENAVVTAIRAAYPSGWSLQDQAVAFRLQLEFVAKPVDLATRTCRQPLTRNSWLRETSDPLFPIFIAPKLKQMFSDLPRFIPAAQTVVDLATVACALERHRLQHGSYPASLEGVALTPPERLPRDIYTAKPLVYRPSVNGYLLYSVGANGVDEEGMPPGADSQGFPDLSTGDWAWVLQ